jgi:S-adenosylmethionine:tRNA ribosyltransferase-isomerase
VITPAPPLEYQLCEYDYPLDDSLIAQGPREDRDRARLMFLDRRSGRIDHGLFSDLDRYLQPEDVLVINNTRVLPARLKGRKVPGGGQVELLLVRRTDDTRQWEALVRGSVTIGQHIEFGVPDSPTAVVRRDLGEGRKVIEWAGEAQIEDCLDRLGLMPLPPYIRRPPTPADCERYQTVYAEASGSVAAPTAGLHFTHALLDRIRARGVRIVPVTLHIGPGTFRPVRSEDIRGHRMDSERFEIGASAVEALEEARRNKGRIFAVGTTSTRVLESAATPTGGFQAASGWTDLFITPGHSFRGVDALLTNFHMPKSTLLMLVAAFAGRRNVQRAYTEAVQERYRFLSYGDAMLAL